MSIVSIVLSWFLLGSIATNFIFLYRILEKNPNIDVTAYCRGIVVGLFSGPVAILFCFKKTLDLIKKESNNG